jgi:hypothetical protein
MLPVYPLVRSLIVHKEISPYFPFSPWGYTLLPPRYLRGNVPAKHKTFHRTMGHIARGCLGRVRV